MMDEDDLKALQDLQGMLAAPAGGPPGTGLPAQANNVPPGGMPPPGLGSIVKNEVLSGPAAQYGRGVVRGVANIGDSVINAGKWVGNTVMGEENGPKIHPLGDAVKEHIDPQFAGADAQLQNDALGKTAAGVANFAGEMTAPLGVGNKAVQGVAGGMAALKSAAPAATRIGGLMQSAGDMLAKIAPTFAKYGAGAAPLPNAGNIANAAARVGTGAGATGVAAITADPSNPKGAAVAAGAGGVAGPAMQKTGDAFVRAKEIADRAGLLPGFAGGTNRVPELAREAVRKVAGDRVPQIQANLAQAGNRVTAGLPVQAAQDPGISALHRTVMNAKPNVSADVTNFLENQKGALASSLESKSAGLSADIAARDKATAPLYDQLHKSEQPVSMLIPARTSVSRILPGGDKQGAKAGKHMLDVLKPAITKHPDGSELPGLLPKGRGLLKQVPAGVVANIRKDINKMMRPDYMPKGGRTPIDDEAKELLGGLNKALNQALNRASPAKGPATVLNRKANDTYGKMSVPVNQKEAMGGLFKDAAKSTNTKTGGRELDPTILANKIEELAGKPKVWNQFTNEQRKYLRQIQQEANTNATAVNYGTGSASDDIAAGAIPEGITTMTRPLPGIYGRAASAGTRLLAGKQIGKVQDELAQILSQPGGVQTIQQILAGMNRAAPTHAGKPAQRVNRLLGASLPSLVSD